MGSTGWGRCSMMGLWWLMAGLLLAGTVMSRLGLEALIDDTGGGRGGSAGSGAGRKVLSLLASMLVGGCCIDDAQRLRSGSKAAVLPFAPLEPSTLGTFLRSFTFGHVRQLDKAAELGLVRAWSVGAAPSVAEMTVDLDSTLCEVCGKAKYGAAYGHTKVLGYHPLVAVRSDTGEVLHSRMRSGSSQRGNVHFARETLARVRRLAAHAAVTVRADAGFFSYDMITALGARNACYSITIPQNAKVKAAIAAIDDDDWASIAYTRGGEAQVAETTIEAGRRGDKLHGDDGQRAELRLIGAPHPPARRPSRAVAQLALPLLRHRQTRPRHQSRRHLPPSPRHPWSSPFVTSKRAPGSAAAPQDDSRQRRLARLLRARAQPRPLDRPPRPRPPHAPTHRRSHHPQPAPHRARPPRPTTAPPQTAPAAQLAMAEHLHHRPANESATYPCSSNPPPRPAQRSPTPPPQPTTAPHSSPARPKTRQPTHTHQTGTNQPNTTPESPSDSPVGGFRLRLRLNKWTTNCRNLLRHRL